MACTSIFDKTPQIAHARATSSIYSNGQFHNAEVESKYGLADGLKAMVRNVTDKSPQAIPSEPIEVVKITKDDLMKAPDQSLWRLGHSTVLLKLCGKFWLTDPVFAERASPFSFAGPKRFLAAPIAAQDLPEIEAVILSHDHYDHLDHDTVWAIKDRVSRFVTPLGVGERLIDWGVPAAKVTQLDWWEEMRIGPVLVIATPAQHFSGRSLTDNNRTLWASWVLITPASRVFFSGDSGYFGGFKTIGNKYGPFDITLLENGAYNEAWPEVHMRPEQTVQAHIDLQGRQLVPIHNSTYDLALHAWNEPLEQVTAIAQEKKVAVGTPRVGERLDIRNPAPGKAWWRTSTVRRVRTDRARTIAAFGTRPSLFASSRL